MTSFFRQPALIAIALTTTSTGMLAPIFRDAGELDTNFGKLFLAAATFGEFGPIVVIVLVFTRAFSYPEQAALMLFFIVVAVVMAVAAMRVRPLGVVRLFHRTLHMSNQLPVRICMLLLTFLIVLAGAFGIDAILGAFAAGMVVGLAARGKDGELLREKIDAIAFGYFVPFFFITSGMRIDLDALRTQLYRDGAYATLPAPVLGRARCAGLPPLPQRTCPRREMAIRAVPRDRASARSCDHRYRSSNA